MRKYLIIVAVLLLAAGCSGRKVKIGETLPVWKEGELDIHFINCGKGECTYQILPDGTTFLVDASGSLLKFGVMASDPLPMRPWDGITPGQVISDYIRQFEPSCSEGHINYMLITHYDSDHIGSCNASLPLHESGEFRLSSLAEIGSNLVIDNFFDRSYPTYDYPTDAYMASKTNLPNYWAFLDWTQRENGTVRAAWDAGSHSQIVPLYKPDCVTVQAYSGNGRFWTGEGEESEQLLPTKEEFETGPEAGVPVENAFSCSYILTYGDFDFFLGGDLQVNDRSNFPYKDVEAPVARKAHKVEVMKANHHGTSNTNDTLIMSVLRPDVWVCSNWRTVQPKPATIDRVIAANPSCDIFCTNMPKENVPILGEDRLSRIDSQWGHVVVRVGRGGHSYMVYSLDDGDQEYTVKSIHGPYSCE